MFVKDKRTGKMAYVYDITYDSNGYPSFLIYDSANHQWVRKSAKYFSPLR